MAELADAADSKSAGIHFSSRFDPEQRHHLLFGADPATCYERWEVWHHWQSVLLIRRSECNTAIAAGRTLELLDRPHVTLRSSTSFRTYRALQYSGLTA